MNGTTNSNLVVKPLRMPSPPPPETTPARPSGGLPPALGLVLGAVVLALAVGASLMQRRAFDRLLSDLDAAAFARANHALEQSLGDKRERALASVKLLVDDTRVRATVITPSFDEATVTDVLDDLRAASGGTVLAVLDVKGRVKARSGADLLRQMDFGSVTAVQAALERPTTTVWTLPDRVLVMAVAPIRSGADVAALFMFGLDVGPPTLDAIERLEGVAGAVVVAERVVATSTRNAAWKPAFETARAVADFSTVSAPDGRPLLARSIRTSDSAAAGRVLWLLPQHHRAEALGGLGGAAFAPAILVAMMLALLALFVRRR